MTKRKIWEKLINEAKQWDESLEDTDIHIRVGKVRCHLWTIYMSVNTDELEFNIDYDDIKQFDVYCDGVCITKQNDGTMAVLED